MAVTNERELLDWNSLFTCCLATEAEYHGVRLRLLVGALLLVGFVVVVAVVRLLWGCWVVVGGGARRLRFEERTSDACSKKL